MKDLIEVEYYGGLRMKLPKWFLFTKGHEIEDILKDAFPCMLGKFPNAGQLQQELTDIMSKCTKGISCNTVQLFNKLGVHQT